MYDCQDMVWMGREEAEEGEERRRTSGGRDKSRWRVADGWVVWEQRMSYINNWHRGK